MRGENTYTDFAQNLHETRYQQTVNALDRAELQKMIDTLARGQSPQLSVDLQKRVKFPFFQSSYSLKRSDGSFINIEKGKAVSITAAALFSEQLS
jgi:ABC-type uncharacterized transport system YnjBCD substrate-binding protein